ncbi:hypothetical protein EVAR_13825_1 [Eumeta japonica]|uniref:Uncharacterized protein n=1 Tax=Eumeta variegata TaxID=151549 RepID=A0A4C1U2J7_EUMVA|nr:hypothetical protein EVAR_13825_1 [Eumeta japonica]
MIDQLIKLKQEKFVVESCCDQLSYSTKVGAGKVDEVRQASGFESCRGDGHCDTFVLPISLCASRVLPQTIKVCNSAHSLATSKTFRG